MSILYIMCMLIYFLKKKGSIHIVQSARCLFILFFCVCFIIYTFTMSGLLSTMKYCVTTHFPLLLLSLLRSFFYHEEIYLSKEKQCYLFVLLQCKYKSSASCKLHSLSCKNLLVTVKSSSQMFMSHICKCMFRLCVYLLGIYQSFYVQTCFWFVYNSL